MVIVAAGAPAGVSPSWPGSSAVCAQRRLGGTTLRRGARLPAARTDRSVSLSLGSRSSVSVCPSRGLVDALLARMSMETRQAAQLKANKRKYLQEAAERALDK